METSRQIPHLQMELETAVTTEKINNNALREKKKFELYGWLSQKQKQEIRLVSPKCNLEMEFEGISDSEIMNRLLEFFSKLRPREKEKWNEIYKKQCIEWIKTVANDNEITELDFLRIKKDVKEYKAKMSRYKSRLPENERDQINLWQICDDIYHQQIGRSEHDFDVLVEKHLQWLTPEQKKEIRQIKASGESLSAIKQKLLSYIEVMETDKQLHIIEKIKHSCYSWLDDVTSVEERIELENLYYANHSAGKQKVHQYIKRLSPEKQKIVNNDVEFCEQIWHTEDNHRRDHEHHHQQHRRVRSLPLRISAEVNRRNKRNSEHDQKNHFQSYLSWLTDDQRSKLKKMQKENKTKTDLQNEVKKYFLGLTCDKKKKAAVELSKGCIDAFKTVLSGEDMKSLKSMTDAGATLKDLTNKLEGMLKNVTDEKKKKIIGEYLPPCRNIYAEIYGPACPKKF
ncbi:unnamed protein product [Onchocerca flexuosa]|uniref:Polyprotein allergen nematode domain-containing protein n=1 Tax=Onchocerca flexuosa TaxID=387005 RepID=A0A183H981_9BILA|nr:unnamed protein product [Onchocerca flexuosa]